MHAWMDACMHTFIHSYIHAYIHTYIHTIMHACIHSYIHTFMHSYIHTYIDTYICLYVCIPLYIYICHLSIMSNFHNTRLPMMRNPITIMWVHQMTPHVRRRLGCYLSSLPIGT